MKTALITTTINFPTVLALYRKLGPDVRFFVAIDEKTPEEAANFLAYDLPNTQISYLKHEWKCSPLLGYNTDSRRNIALLEAVKWGAEIIVSIDDDMIPMSPDFFQRIEDTLISPYSGLCFGAEGEWFNATSQTMPPTRQRGLPTNFYVNHPGRGFVHNVQIGAMQGIILGTPDTDASTTIVNRPFVHSVTDIARSGFVVDTSAKAVFNSQITAFRRELAPAFAQFYKWQGRNTDIFASLIMRRIMRDRDLYTFYGPPTGFHARSDRHPIGDLKTEMWGAENVERFTKYLDENNVLDKRESVLEQLRALHFDLGACAYWSKQASEAALAFLDDMKSVL